MYHAETLKTKTLYRYLKHLNTWKQRHTEKSEEVRLLRQKILNSQLQCLNDVAEITQPKWETDSDEELLVQNSKAASSSRKRYV